MVKKLLAATVLLAVALFLGRAQISEVLFSKAMESRMASSMKTTFQDGLHVGLCGAGSPLPDPVRSQPCTLVIAGDKTFVFDVGSSVNIGLMGVQPSVIDGIFLTHFHSDHIGAMGELAMQRWVAGNHTKPLPVYGPAGVGRIVDGFNMAYGADNHYRTAHHGEAIAPTSGKGMVANTFLAKGDEKLVVYESENLVVSAFNVGHSPVEPAVGYRIDYKGRSVVISGDTVKSDTVLKYAKGVDLLVHEALSRKLVKLAEESAKKVGQKTMQKIFFDIQDYHTDPEEAAQLANAAGAKHLVLTHIVPTLPLPGMKKAFLGRSHDFYDGPITIGQDGDFFSLPVGSSEILISNRL